MHGQKNIKLLIHCPVQKSLRPVVLSHTKPLHFITPYFLKLYLNILSHLHLGIPIVLPLQILFSSVRTREQVLW
jgi:hypothetical protein